MIVKTLPGGLIEVGVERIAFQLPALALCVLGEDLGLRRGEDAVEPAPGRSWGA